jgi:purine nucleoside permease
LCRKIGIVSGVGTARAAASIMALGMDPRFDLTRAYWLVAGIAGVNPLEASIGSAAWVEWVVDADLAFEIDAREIPAEWSTGYLPLGKTRPYEEPVEADGARWVYRLDPGLVAWAYWLTADMRSMTRQRCSRPGRATPNSRRRRRRPSCCAATRSVARPSGTVLC